MMHKAWCSIGEVPYCFLRPSIKSKVTGQKKIGSSWIEITWPVAAIKSLRFALLVVIAITCSATNNDKFAIMTTFVFSSSSLLHWYIARSFVAIRLNGIYVTCCNKLPYRSKFERNLQHIYLYLHISYMFCLTYSPVGEITFCYRTCFKRVYYLTHRNIL